ncbi:MAG: GNAT family N-acetyltransferase [Vulcanimicrobiota bacterium]
MLRLLTRREKWPFESPNGRLLLRPLQRADIDHIRRWFHDKDLIRLAFGTSADGPTLDRLAREYCEEIQSGRRNALAIWTPDGRFIGFVRFNLRRRGRERIARVGIMIGQRMYWNGGFGTEAMMALNAYLFTRRQTNLIELDTADFNTRAQRCFEKCGFRRKREQNLVSLVDGSSSTKIWMELDHARWQRDFAY